MADEYIRELRKQLKGFSTKEQDAMIEEISSHIEEGEKDLKMGKDADQRRKRLMNELGSPKDLAKGFKETYRPNRLIDFLLTVIPLFFYPYLNHLYTILMPKYSWADVRLDLVIHLPLIAIGLWRRSAPLTLFWITVTVFQLLIVTTEIYGYYGSQTIFWAFVLVALLVLAGYILWKNRDDLLIVVFGLTPLSMCILGSILSALHVTDYSFGVVGRSLLLVHTSYIENLAFYGLLGSMALFFLPANRGPRWLALVIYGLHLGLGHYYLNEVFAAWVYYLWAVLPLVMIFFGWWLEQSKRPQLELATS
jgi:hypothetical protein